MHIAARELGEDQIPIGAGRAERQDQPHPQGRIVTEKEPAQGEGRPERTNIWLDPRNAGVIDQASADSGPVRVMHVLHGSLMVPGWGRTIVGWVGAFMFVSCLTGIWLWWPLSGSFTTGFRWRRRNTVNANIHYLAGFWIMIPLAMLSFTGAWISFPKVFGMFESRPATSQQDRAADVPPAAMLDGARQLLTPQPFVGGPRADPQLAAGLGDGQQRLGPCLGPHWATVRAASRSGPSSQPAGRPPPTRVRTARTNSERRIPTPRARVSMRSAVSRRTRSETWTPKPSGRSAIWPST